MENATYTAITRQSGLMNEMRVVANNLANISTTGYRGEGVIFAEHVTALGPDDPSLSMATAAARETLNAQGALSQTGGGWPCRNRARRHGQRWRSTCRASWPRDPSERYGNGSRRRGPVSG